LIEDYIVQFFEDQASAGRAAFRNINMGAWHIRTIRINLKPMPEERVERVGKVVRLSALGTLHGSSSAAIRAL
jgi:hypothetical protein